MTTATTADALDGLLQPSPDDGWSTLATGRGPATGEPPGLGTGRLAVRIAAIALVVLAVVGLSGVLISRRLAQQQAVHDVAVLTDVLAQSVVQPALTDALLTDPAAASRTLGPLVRSAVLSDSLVHVKIWTPAGTVLYSDEAALIGQTFRFEDDARTALTAPRTEANISDLSRPENRFERGEGRLLEVYRPVWTPQGQPLLFETYFRYTTVSERTGQLWRAFAGLMLSSILVLFLLLIPLVWGLVRRTRTAQREREAMLQRAVDASGQERARIAASLHDGIVSQLAGTSFDVAARAVRARAGDEPEHAAELDDVAAAVRASIGGLRALLVEIYPPGLTAAGLPAALRDLVNATSSGARVDVDVDEDLARSLHPDASDAVFRVGRECLRNAEKHAGASTIWVRLGPGPDGDGSVRLDVEDDGIGFDAAEVREHPGSGHFGLLLIADAARAVGARLQLRTAPGAGTHYRMDIAAS